MSLTPAAYLDWKRRNGLTVAAADDPDNQTVASQLLFGEPGGAAGPSMSFAPMPSPTGADVKPLREPAAPSATTGAFTRTIAGVPGMRFNVLTKDQTGDTGTGELSEVTMPR